MNRLVIFITISAIAINHGAAAKAIPSESSNDVDKVEAEVDETVKLLKEILEVFFQKYGMEALKQTSFGTPSTEAPLTTTSWNAEYRQWRKMG